MMWRGAVFSSLLHGGLLIGLVGSLPILPRIFDRSIESESIELQIAVDVVSAAALEQFTDAAGIRDAAPDEETAGRSGALALRALTPPAPQQSQTPRPSPSPSDVKKAPTSSAQRATPLSPARSTTFVSLPGRRNPDRQIPSRQNSEDPAPEAQQRADVLSAAITAASTDTPVQNESKETPQSAIATEFIGAVSGRQRDLVIDVLNDDARLRRTVSRQDEASDIPEQARTRTLARLQKSAKAGFSHAQYNLAGKYLRGEDVARDLSTAQAWLTRAAEQGYAPAQSLLALMRFTGKGSEQTSVPDVAEAAFWWSLAAEAGNAGAKVATERLKPLLKPQEHVQAQKLRARWGSLINDLADLTTGETSRHELDRALQSAAEKGDLDAVLSLLAKGADADQSGDAGRNAVIAAAWRGRQRIIQLLLDRGVETEVPDDDGRTPLIWAAINGHDTIVTNLVAGGANPNKKDRDGGTALIRAAWNGHLSVVALLIGAGAELNAQDDNGLTALAHARRERNTAVVRLLEQSGAR